MASKIDPAVEKELKAIRAALKANQDYTKRVDALRVKNFDAVSSRINELAKAVNKLNE